ncbi:DUF1727 domain-containing protein [Dolosigranulum pigrum]|nr:DUF1727 domain-containing protein [Dolosigranulum pigrum]
MIVNSKILSNYEFIIEELGSMTLKSTIATSTAKLAKMGLNATKRSGSSLPGKLAQRIDPEIISHLTDDKQVILVTGTNGKTTTTALLSEMLRTEFDVVTNDSGANMEQGLITSLILKGQDKDIAVLETDEVYVRKLSPQLTIDYLVITNVFDDQVDRLGSKEQTLQTILAGVKHQPQAKLVLNGDLELMHEIDIENHQLFFGKDFANANYKLHDVSIGLNQSQLKINDTALTAPFSGMYNMYNVAAAYAVAKELGISDEHIAQALRNFKRIEGRQEVIHIAGKDVVFNLVKNTAGFNATLDVIKLDSRQKACVLAFNNKPADGEDMSWLDEADFEQLANMSVTRTYYGGMYQKPLGERARRAGFDELIEFNSPEELLGYIKCEENDVVHIVANYTALYDIRNEFVKLGVIDE